MNMKSEICCIIIFEIKNPTAISGDQTKNQFHTPTPTNSNTRKQKPEENLPHLAQYLA